MSTAIQSRPRVEFDYGDRHRVVIPWIHGTHVSTRNHVMRGDQVFGTSRSGLGSGHNMRMFDVALIKNLSVTPQTFPANTPGYVRGDSEIIAHCEL